MLRQFVGIHFLSQMSIYRVMFQIRLIKARIIYTASYVATTLNYDDQQLLPRIIVAKIKFEKTYVLDFFRNMYII